jgi:hypothetical protein
MRLSLGEGGSLRVKREGGKIDLFINHFNEKESDIFYLFFTVVNWDKSAAGFCRQVAKWVPDMF